MAKSVHRFVVIVILIVALDLSAWAGTRATFQTILGTMELDLFDDDKPITVSNFITYVTYGAYENAFIERWEPNSLIQAGGYRTPKRQTGPLLPVRTFGIISNEYRLGRTFSNTYGTIAMARKPGEVNSAVSQWFINLGDNAFLDSVDEGFTVFGKVVSGTNVLRLFGPPPPVNGLYRANVGGTLSRVPVLGPVTTANEFYSNLVYFDITLRRDLDLSIQTLNREPKRQISWKTIPDVINSLEYKNWSSASWNELTNVVGTGTVKAVIDSSTDKARTYRVKLIY